MDKNEIKYKKRVVWSREATDALIRLYASYDLLYNTAHEYYHNKMLRQHALIMIAQSLQNVREGTTDDDVRKGINLLRTRFAAGYSKVLRAKAAGKKCLIGEDLKQLMFLKNFIGARHSLTGSPLPKNTNDKDFLKTFMKRVYVDKSNKLPSYDTQEYVSDDAILTTIRSRMDFKSSISKDTSAFIADSDETQSSNNSDDEPVSDLMEVIIAEESNSLPGVIEQPNKQGEKGNISRIEYGKTENDLSADSDTNLQEEILKEEMLFASFVKNEVYAIENKVLRTKCKHEILEIIIKYQKKHIETE